MVKIQLILLGIGLVVFSGESYSRCPLTADYTLLKKYIDEINFDLISTRGTAIGSAIAIATNTGIAVAPKAVNILGAAKLKIADNITNSFFLSIS